MPASVRGVRRLFVITMLASPGIQPEAHGNLYIYIYTHTYIYTLRLRPRPTTMYCLHHNDNYYYDDDAYYCCLLLLLLWSNQRRNSKHSSKNRNLHQGFAQPRDLKRQGSSVLPPMQQLSSLRQVPEGEQWPAGSRTVL